MEDEKDRTLWVGNLSDKVTEELLYELFLQAGPLQKVKIPTKDGQSLRYAFITFKHVCSVPYTIELMDGICLFGNSLRLQSRTGSVHQNNGNLRQNSPSVSQDYNRRDRGRSQQQDPRLSWNQNATASMHRSNSWQGSHDRDRSRSNDRSSHRGQSERDLSVIALSGQFTPNSPSPRDLDPLSMQLKRERILSQQSRSIDIHRQSQQFHMQNPYNMNMPQPWQQQQSYRR